MKRTSAFFTAGLLFATGSAFSQGGGIGAGTGMRSTPAEVSATFNYPAGSSVLVVSGAAYSGRNSNTSVRTLGNGTHLTQQGGQENITYRDSVGRVRTERSLGPVFTGPSGYTPPAPIFLPEIQDPIAGYRYVLDPVHRIAHRIPVEARQMPPEIPSGSSTGGLTIQTRAPQVMQNGVTSVSEDLGTQKMFGVTVNGQKYTTTYPVGTFQGNDRPVIVVQESWRALRYNLVLLSKSSGSEAETTSTIRDFNTAEPDPTLFQVPAGFKIVDENGQFTITVPRQAQ